MPTEAALNRAAAGALTVLLACPGVLAAAPRPSRAADESSALRSLQEKMQSLMDDLAPEIPRLRGFHARYRTEAELREAQEERHALREKLNAGHDALKALGDRYKELEKTRHMEMFAGVLSRMGARGAAAKKGSVLSHAGATYGNAMELEEFFQRANEFRKDIRSALSDDESEYLEASESFAERRRNIRLLWGLGANLSIALALVWLFRRKSRALERALASPPPGRERLLPAPSETPAPRTGLLLNGNYRLDREIGRGGMGLVYEAMDLTLQRKVAVKAMREELLQNPRDLELFLAEARLVAALKHPNVVEIYTVLKEGSRVYLVFEHVSGKTLDKLLQERGRFPLSAVKGLLSHAAAALDYAHGRRVIHRDLKPSNIMLTDERIVKVMDFGIAHRAKLTAARMTRAESCGTPPYMAPEQELGSVSRESDLYALGVCVYEMAVGRLPFQGPNFLAQKRELRYPPPSRAAGLPEVFDAVILRALDPEPSRRFHSAGEFNAAMSAIADC